MFCPEQFLTDGVLFIECFRTLLVLSYYGFVVIPATGSVYLIEFSQYEAFLTICFLGDIISIWYTIRIQHLEGRVAKDLQLVLPLPSVILRFASHFASDFLVLDRFRPT